MKGKHSKGDYYKSDRKPSGSGKHMSYGEGYGSGKHAGQGHGKDGYSEDYGPMSARKRGSGMNYGPGEKGMEMNNSYYDDNRKQPGSMQHANGYEDYTQQGSYPKYVSKTEPGV